MFDLSTINVRNQDAAIRHAATHHPDPTVRCRAQYVLDGKERFRDEVMRILDAEFYDSDELN